MSCSFSGFVDCTSPPRSWGSTSSSLVLAAPCGSCYSMDNSRRYKFPILPCWEQHRLFGSRRRLLLVLLSNLRIMGQLEYSSRKSYSLRIRRTLRKVFLIRRFRKTGKVSVCFRSFLPILAFFDFRPAVGAVPECVLIVRHVVLIVVVSHFYPVLQVKPTVGADKLVTV